MSGRALAIDYPRDVRAEAVEAALLRLHGLLRSTALAAPPRLAFEFVGTEAGISASLWCSSAPLAGAAASTLKAALPGGRIAPGQPLALDRVRAYVRLTLGRGDSPLRSDLPAAALTGLLAPLAAVKAEELGVVQFVLQPAPPGARARLLRRAAEAESRRPSPFGGWLSPRSGRHRARAMREKAASPLYRAGVMVAASSPRLADDLAAGFAQFAAPSARVRRHRVLSPSLAHEQLVERRLPAWWPAPTLVGVTELAAMLAPTPEGLRDLRGPVVRSRRLRPPTGAARAGRVLCLANDGGAERRVALKRADTRLHTWLIGPTGTGKSTLLAHQVLDAARRGDGAVFLDPKGDAIEDVLRRLPEERASDVVVLDPVGERDHPVGLNLLERGPGQDAAAVTEAIMGVLRDLFARNWGARTDDTLYNGIFCAAAVNGTTLAELPRLYTSKEFRRPFVAAVADPFIRDFWSWFDGLSPAQRGTLLAPALNKLRPLLRPDLAPIIGQRRSTIDLGRVLAERRLLLVRLPRDGALFGSLLVARLWQAAQRRMNQLESRRPDVLLAIDEVHSFLRTGADLGELLAMARGLRISLCVASQHLEQCPPELRAALLANARTRVVFQADETDGAALAKGFAPYLDAQDLAGLGRYEVAVRMAVDGTVSAPFTGRTPPLSPPLRASSAGLRRASRARYAIPRATVEADLRERLSANSADVLAQAPIGRHSAETKGDRR